MWFDLWELDDLEGTLGLDTRFLGCF